jgi:hypothetical protein
MINIAINDFGRTGRLVDTAGEKQLVKTNFHE